MGPNLYVIKGDRQSYGLMVYVVIGSTILL